MPYQIPDRGIFYLLILIFKDVLRINSGDERDHFNSADLAI